MSKVLTLDKNGNYVYDGFLTSKEKATVDDILNALKSEIPMIESELNERYGSSVSYKYYLGKTLSNILDKYNITYAERRKFWDEIKYLASNEKRKRNEGSNAVTRSFYEQCYVLSKIDEDTVNKLSWRQWQSLLDRIDTREDERIYTWIKNKEEKLREDDWREFQKGLHAYLKNKDTSVFNDEELFKIYNDILNMSKYWRIEFTKFEKENPKSAKIKTKSKRSKKYQTLCFELKKQKRCELNENIFKESFEEAMK